MEIYTHQKVVCSDRSCRWGAIFARLPKSCSCHLRDTPSTRGVRSLSSIFPLLGRYLRGRNPPSGDVRLFRINRVTSVLHDALPSTMVFTFQSLSRTRKCCRDFARTSIRCQLISETQSRFEKKLEHRDMHDEWWVLRTLMEQTAPSP